VLVQAHTNGTTIAATLNGGPARTHLYFPAVEGLGETYRRVMLNEYFGRLLERTRLKTIAELPLDDYGVVGAGSVIFAQRGCHVRLISDDRGLLVDGMRVFEHNQLQAAVQLVQAEALTGLPVPDDSYDLGWNFDRLLTLPDPADFLREMARVCKAVFVCVPNAHNYGQYAHYMYHKVKGDRCAYVEPRAWMARRPVRETLQRLGLEVVDEGLIDVPWWPGFPELPDLVRRLLGKRLADSPLRQQPIPPASQAEEQQWLDKVARASFIERSRWPAVVRQFFAHNVYVLAVKPEFRASLGF
jgi:SAM-dependent methyltransferase